MRSFPDDIKMEVWEEQHHICPHCHKEFDFEFMEGDHITPWSKGGKTVKEDTVSLSVSERSFKKRDPSLWTSPEKFVVLGDQT